MPAVPLFLHFLVLTSYLIAATNFSQRRCLQQILCYTCFLLFQLCASILPLGCSYVDVSWLHHIPHTKLDEFSLQGPSVLPRNDTPSPMIDAVDWKIGTKLRPHCPAARMRTAGLSNRFCRLSVSQSVMSVDTKN